MAKSWYVHWDNLMIFLGYPEEIRKIIYTTNAVESVNSQLRKITKNKRVFPNDNAVFKSLYLAIDYMTKKWSMSIPNKDILLYPYTKMLTQKEQGILPL
ncbi:transposase [Rickettsia felis]|uniref:transposase n=1 Tax=Rickettsia felis TaxID=42862 RepID=UPI00191C23EF|nr:transposase [Rickettsia felis]